MNKKDTLATKFTNYMNRNLYEMFRWLNTNDAVFIKDLNVIKKELPGLPTLEDWVREYFK